LAYAAAFEETYLDDDWAGNHPFLTDAKSRCHAAFSRYARPTRVHMKQDVADYMRYYNNDRLHTTNQDMSPVKYELSEMKVSGNG